MSYQLIIKEWHIRYGQISFTGENYQKAYDFFKPYFGKDFTLSTFKTKLVKRKFNVNTEKRSIRLSGEKFFGQLKENDIIYFKPIDADTLGVYDTLPDDDELSPVSEEPNIINNQNLKNSEDTSIENKGEVVSVDEAPIEVANAHELLFFEILKYMILKGNINEIREVNILNKLGLEWAITAERVNFLKQLARIE